MQRHLVVKALILLAVLSLVRVQLAGQEAVWPTYAGDPGGQRFSPAKQINLDSLKKLHVAWIFHTHALDTGHSGAFESTPILFQGRLYFTSPTDKVFALNPETGQKIWSYEPGLDWSRDLGIVTSRGVAAWSDPDVEKGFCSRRIFLGTLDGRLLALDADTGRLCPDFGAMGTIDLTQNVDYRKGDDYAVTSPPAVVGNVVIVGSGIADNLRVNVERGDVRGFDAKSGKLLWTWEPLPWANQQKLRTGAGNTWGPIAVDPQHHLAFLPTSSPSPDYYGGMRPGDNRDADSVVALDANTGKKVWAFQLVHHDIWDYDVAAEPLLFDYKGIPAVAVASKTGMVFVLNRLTGQPLVPVEERRVPSSDVPGETGSSTQPFSSLPPLSPLSMDLTKPLGLTHEDDIWCRKEIAKMRYEGVFTPPSKRGTVEFPSNVGGVNWGSMAFDPSTGTIYANTNRLPFRVTLVNTPWIAPNYEIIAIAIVGGVLALLVLLFAFRFGGWKASLGVVGMFFAMLLLAKHYREIIKIELGEYGWNIGGVYLPHFGREYGRDTGTPYAVYREMFEHNHNPCSPMPWGAVTALNLHTGKLDWETPLGSKVKDKRTGNWSVGGPIVTGGGLLFTAAVPEPYLRAFDLASGEEVWKAELPAPAEATPMTYEVNGKQYVVVAAGGHPGLSGLSSDSLVAFALP